MLSLKHCDPSELAAIFDKSRDEIVAEWVQQTGALLHELHLDKPTLMDHVPEVIDDIIFDLACGGDQAAAGQLRKKSAKHGVQRLYDGLDVGQVVAEYNLLRITFYTVAEAHGYYVAGRSSRIINRGIDQSVRTSVVAFANEQSLLRKQREREHLSFLAHDVRTPLNAISLVVDELKQGFGALGPAEFEELFDILHRNLRRAEGLIKKVLQSEVPLSADGHSFKPECREFELWPLVQGLILELRSIADHHTVEVANQIPRTLSVFGDAGLLAQAFQNLLSNSFKYTSRGRVTLSAGLNGDRTVTCSVQDNGAGIPAAMLDKVFDKLTTDPEKGGTGLGLAIVKQIIEAHGGSISVESTEGAGATFTFTIPGTAA